MKSTIFLIDDDAVFNLINEKLIKLVYKDVLVKSFMKSDVAFEYLQAIAHDNWEYDCIYIFLDINMPYFDGWEFLQRCRVFSDAFKNCLNFYLLTSSVSPDDMNKAKKFNEVKEFVSKPLTKDILLRLVKQEA